MSTKAELEARISEQAVTIRRHVEALASLTAEAGIVVKFSSTSFNAGSAPYVKETKEFHRPDAWSEKVMPIVLAAVQKHGVRLEPPMNIPREPFLDLGRGIYGRGEEYLVPSIVGDFIIELLNAAADFGRVCYAAGVQEGSDVLRQLAEGKISAGEYEDRVAREKALDVQSHRRFAVGKFSE